MSNDGKVDCSRRRLLVATATIGGLGGVAVAVPFVTSMMPSERAKAAGAPVEVDINDGRKRPVAAKRSGLDPGNAAHVAGNCLVGVRPGL